jgi:hypothetical protein
MCFSKTTTELSNYLHQVQNTTASPNGFEVRRSFTTKSLIPFFLFPFTQIPAQGGGWKVKKGVVRHITAN